MGRRFFFDVREASNGQEAIDVWEDFAPHLIWMDMRMPVMDGYEATRYIKSEIQNSKSKIQTVIIALTASSVEDEQAITLSIGCDNVVRKPFREEDIFAIMHKHLGVRYVYEDSQKSIVESRKSKTEDVLTPEDLAKLPDEVYTELQQAVNTANLKVMQRLIERIRKQNVSLANTLTALVNQFRFDILQSLFKET